MIDCDKEDEDPIVAEVRRAREQLLEKFNYDVEALVKHLQQEHPKQMKYASPAGIAANSSAKQVG